jgi:hypothetical protein
VCWACWFTRPRKKLTGDPRTARSAAGGASVLNDWLGRTALHDAGVHMATTIARTIGKWLRAVISAARVGEQSAVEWKLV